jgi:hypothetical protein
MSGGSPARFEALVRAETDRHQKSSPTPRATKKSMWRANSPPTWGPRSALAVAPANCMPTWNGPAGCISRAGSSNCHGTVLSRLSVSRAPCNKASSCRMESGPSWSAAATSGDAGTVDVGAAAAGGLERHVPRPPALGVLAAVRGARRGAALRMRRAGLRQQPDGERAKNGDAQHRCCGVGRTPAIHRRPAFALARRFRSLDGRMPGTGARLDRWVDAGGIVAMGVSQRTETPRHETLRHVLREHRSV